MTLMTAITPSPTTKTPIMMITMMIKREAIQLITKMVIGIRAE